jgi:hypothetical protein
MNKKEKMDKQRNVKVLYNSGSLSETDLTLISGTELLLNLMRNRLLVMVNGGGQELNWQALMEGVQGLYHIRRIDTDKLYQIWFENKFDIEKFEKNLLLAKLSDTTENE